MYQCKIEKNISHFKCAVLSSALQMNLFTFTIYNVKGNFKLVLK